MHDRATGSRLSGLRLTDPHHEPGWTHAVVPASGGAALPAAARTLRADIHGAGRTRDLESWLSETYGTSLVVVDRGEVVHDWYAEGLGPETLFLGASMTKSVLAHLVGRAIRRGALALDDRVVAHVPELAGTGYDGPTVADVATMTSGVDWFEDHRDPEGPASRLMASFHDRGDSRALLHLLRPSEPPGTRFAYCTADSQVLDWVRERATGRTYAEELTELWDELGCESDCVVGTDGRGVAMAGGALAATARDWTRLGMLAIDGTASGQRILGSDWVESAARARYPFLEPGRLPSSITTHAGFGYHWWPLDTSGRAVAADGSRGQFTYVDRSVRVVVVKTSQWPYDDWLVDRQHRDLSYLGLPRVAEAAVRQREAANQRRSRQ